MKYIAPEIPITPSSKINYQLQTRFGHPPDNLVKSLFAHYICAVFYSINLLHDALKKTSFFSDDDDDKLNNTASVNANNANKNIKNGGIFSTFDGNYKAWIVSCSLVPLMLTFSCYLLFKIIIASSFLAETVLAYGLASFAWVALAAGICGALFYDGFDSKGSSKVQGIGKKIE